MQDKYKIWELLSWVESEKSFITTGPGESYMHSVLQQYNLYNTTHNLDMHFWFLNVIRPNKKIPVFRVIWPYLNLLVNLDFFRFSGKKIILCILKGKMPFKIHKIIYFSSEKKIIKKYVCLPYLKCSDLLSKTHLFFIWPDYKDIIDVCYPTY